MLADAAVGGIGEEVPETRTVPSTRFARPYARPIDENFKFVAPRRRGLFWLLPRLLVVPPALEALTPPMLLSRSSVEGRGEKSFTVEIAGEGAVIRVDGALSRSAEDDTAGVFVGVGAPIRAGGVGRAPAAASADVPERVLSRRASVGDGGLPFTPAIAMPGNVQDGSGEKWEGNGV